MKVEHVSGSILTPPTAVDDVSSVKIFNRHGQLIAVAFELGEMTLVAKADEPDFHALCRQYGIKASPAEVVDI